MSEIRTDTINNASGDNDSGIDLSTNDQVKIKIANTDVLKVSGSSSPTIESLVSDGDIVFKGNDGGSTITALTLDMSEAGDATFNRAVKVVDDARISWGNDGDLVIFHENGASNKIYGTTAHHIDIHTSNVSSPRMRIKDDGNVLINKTNASSSVQGCFFSSNGNHLTRSDSNVILVNRQDSDGQLMGFANADSTEGNISVSGGTVSFNGFSASHWSRLNDNSKPTILKGTVIETIDEMMDWYQLTFTVPATDDTPEHSPKISIALEDGQSVGDTITYNHDGTDYQATIIQEADNKHTKCKISDTADSTRVYGVFADWDNDDDTVNDMYVTAVGTHVVRVHSSATVSAGDLLTSNGDGTAKVQDDDIIRSKTIGKVLTNIKQETYSDGSYTVPCALYCG